MGFLLRWGFAFALLAATYNPTKWNYAHWANVGWGEQMSLVVLAGLNHFFSRERGAGPTAYDVLEPAIDGALGALTGE